ncbi:MAG: hypothetical protein IPH95_00790 [Candidatus Promineofilum sp.]|jgi:hypothetical protein|nr:hypothetical protein [Promineifilum sp.]
MKPDAVFSHDYEQALIDIVRVLPPNRAEQLVEFARFLEGQLLAEAMFGEETAREIEADNARWDALLESDEGQSLLDKLANEALAAHRAGLTKPMSFDDQGRLTPG